jgi:hypothetical protein
VKISSATSAAIRWMLEAEERVLCNTVIPSGAEGSRCETFKVTSAGSLDPATAGLGMTATERQRQSAGRPNLIRPAPYYYQETLNYLLTLVTTSNRQERSLLESRWIDSILIVHWDGQIRD